MATIKHLVLSLWLLCSIYMYQIDADGISVEKYLIDHLINNPEAAKASKVEGAKKVQNWNRVNEIKIPLPESNKDYTYYTTIPIDFGLATARVDFSVRVDPEEDHRYWQLAIPAEDSSKDAAALCTIGEKLNKRALRQSKLEPKYGYYRWKGKGILDINPLPKNQIEYLQSFWMNMLSIFNVGYARTTDSTKVHVHDSDGRVTDKTVPLMFVRAFAGQHSTYTTQGFYEPNIASLRSWSWIVDDKSKTMEQNVLNKLSNTPFSEIYKWLNEGEKTNVDEALRIAHLSEAERENQKITTIGEVMTKLWYGHKLYENVPEDSKQWVTKYQPQWFEIWNIIRLSKNEHLWWFDKYLTLLTSLYMEMKMYRPNGGWESLLQGNKLPMSFKFDPEGVDNAHMEMDNEYRENEQYALKKRLFALQQRYKKMKRRYHRYD